LNVGFDFAFLPLITETPWPTPFERLRLTMIPGYGPGLPSGSSICPGNSAWVTSVSPDDVESPVCGDDVPLRAMCRMAEPPLCAAALTEVVMVALITSATAALTTAAAISVAAEAMRKFDER